jgi:hypothetical protein
MATQQPSEPRTEDGHDVGSLATVLEVVAVVAIGNGLREIYPPLLWLWLGAAAFVVSYLLELQQHAEQPDRQPAPGAQQMEASTDADDVDQELTSEPAWASSPEAVPIADSVRTTKSGLEIFAGGEW